MALAADLDAVAALQVAALLAAVALRPSALVLAAPVVWAGLPALRLPLCQRSRKH